MLLDIALLTSINTILSNGDIIPYKYSVEETLSAIYYDTSYIKHAAYTIEKDGLNFTNILDVEKIIVPVKPNYNNSLTIKHNIEGTVDVTLKMLESKYTEDYKVVYSDNYNGFYYNISAENGTKLDGLLSGKYEIVVNNSDYTLNSINIEDNENTSLSIENGKYYLIIESKNADSKATLVLDLEKKSHKGYQTSEDINNFWKTDVSTSEDTSTSSISLFSDTVEAPLPVIEDAETEDTEISEPIENTETSETIEDTKTEDTEISESIENTETSEITEETETTEQEKPLSTDYFETTKK